MTQHQINEEKKRKFEEDIIEVAVAEYINFATNQYMQSLKNFEEGKKDGKD